MRQTLAHLSCLVKPGKGMPLVLLHGISSDAESFRALMEAVPNPCYAWDMAGYGHSPFLESDYVAQLKAFTLQFEAFTLLGSSLGALIAAKFTALHPSTVHRLILASPASGYGTPNMPQNVQARLDMLRDEGAANYAEKRAKNLINKSETKLEILKNVQRAMAGLRLEGLTKASQFLSESDIHAYAKAIYVETKILVGENDAITPPLGVKAILPSFPPNIAHYMQIPDAGHALIQEQPQTIARFIP
jgi:pimeloyl-ACP methyl ester carboxylesterase